MAFSPLIILVLANSLTDLRRNYKFENSNKVNFAKYEIIIQGITYSSPITVFIPCGNSLIQLHHQPTKMRPSCRKVTFFFPRGWIKLNTLPIPLKSAGWGGRLRVVKVKICFWPDFFIFFPPQAVALLFFAGPSGAGTRGAEHKCSTCVESEDIPRQLRKWE